MKQGTKPGTLGLSVTSFAIPCFVNPFSFCCFLCSLTLFPDLVTSFAVYAYNRRIHPLRFLLFLSCKNSNINFQRVNAMAIRDVSIKGNSQQDMQKYEQNKEWEMKLLDRARVQVRFCSHFSLSPSFLVLECSSFAIALLVIFQRKKRPTMYCLHSCLHINSCTLVNSDKETSDAEV